MKSPWNHHFRKNRGWTHPPAQPASSTSHPAARHSDIPHRWSTPTARSPGRRWARPCPLRLGTTGFRWSKHRCFLGEFHEKWGIFFWPKMGMGIVWHVFFTVRFSKLSSECLFIFFFVSFPQTKFREWAFHQKLTGAFHAGNGWGGMGLSWLIIHNYVGTFSLSLRLAPVRKALFFLTKNA